MTIGGCAVHGDAAPSRTQARRIEEERREFASFIDGFFAGIQKNWKIPGMAFIAVSGGEVLYLKGYGLADVESGRPVSPDATLFRVGAISTVVTAAALLQFVEKGSLLLDEDINKYLRRWKLPSTFEDPVTLRHLLTHTGGFDGKRLEICAPTSADERNYAVRLQKIMPARSAPPGVFYSFSPMGYALVGTVIERYSRQDFASAIARNIFRPLGMNNSAFIPTDEQAKNMAKGYDEHGKAVRYAYFYDMPAEGMSATASDMGRFMLASLDGGALGRNRILQPMYANSMLRTHFSPHPRIEGTGLAYREKIALGLRTLQQSGNMPGYSSFLMLIPEKNFGLFFAANISGLDFNDDLAAAVAGRFFQRTGDARRDQPSPSKSPVSMDIEGYYRHNDISRHTAEKAANMLGDQLRVSVSDGFVLVSHTNKKDERSRWAFVESSPDISSGDLFRGVDENGGLNDEYIFFQRGRSDDVTAMVMGEARHTYDKLKPHEGHYAQIAAIACFVMAFVVSCLGLLLGNAINNGRLPWEKGLRSAAELWVISLLFCAIQLFFVLGILLSIHYLGRQFVVFVPYQVKALFIVPLAGALLLAWFWFRLISSILNPDHHWGEKLLLIAVAGVETCFLLFLADWRLVGFMF
jgi:CubicO group peptidase (beta-lactamase class C family)